MIIRKLRSKTGYKEIIEVNVPIRFYWTENGFDGVELGPFDEKISRYQSKLLYHLLDRISEFMEKEEKEPIPTSFLKAFEEAGK